MPNILRRCTLWFAFILLLPLQAAHSDEGKVRKLVAPGVEYLQEIAVGETSQIINVLKINLKAKGVRVETGQAGDKVILHGAFNGREGMLGMARRHGAMAAVNGDFFPFTGDPLGISIRNGELLSESLSHRACLGITPKGVVMDVLLSVGTWRSGDSLKGSLDGLNRLPAENEIVLATPSLSAADPLPRAMTVMTLKQANLPFKVSEEVVATLADIRMVVEKEKLPECPKDGIQILIGASATIGEMSQVKLGEQMSFKFDLVSNSVAQPPTRYPKTLDQLKQQTPDANVAPIWKEATQAISGGPFLVRDGKVWIDGQAQGFNAQTFVAARHPRTAAGVNEKGELLLVTVDGRSVWSRGMSLPELAELMLRLGCVQAINLDGGGSTTMVVRDSIVNMPSDGRERPVSNGLLVFGEPSGESVDFLTLASPDEAGIDIRMGESFTLMYVPKFNTVENRESQIFYGTAEGFGFVSQKGVFTGNRAGTGKLRIRYFKQELLVPVKVAAVPPPKP